MIAADASSGRDDDGNDDPVIPVVYTAVVWLVRRVVNTGGEGRCEEVDELVTGVAISCQYDVGSNGVPPGKRARATPEARVGLTSDVIWPDECRSPLAPFDHHPLLYSDRIAPHCLLRHESHETVEPRLKNL